LVLFLHNGFCKDGSYQERSFLLLLMLVDDVVDAERCGMRGFYRYLSLSMGVGVIAFCLSSCETREGRKGGIPHNGANQDRPLEPRDKNVSSFQKRPEVNTRAISYNLQTSLHHLVLEIPEGLDNVERKPSRVWTYIRSGGELIDDGIDVGLRYRGNSSYEKYPKKQFSIEVKGGKFKNETFGFLDLPADDDFVLYAPYGDKTLVRNVLTYNLYNKMGHYAPRTRFVTVAQRVSASVDKPLGLYVLMEKIQLDANRLNIKKKDASGQVSYLMRFDRIKDRRQYVLTDKGSQVIVDYPKIEDFDDDKRTTLMTYLNRFEAALLDKDVAAADKALQWVDLDSLADFLIMQEYARNIDGYRLSCYFYLPIGGKLTFGPLWDFDIAYGNVDLYEGWKTEGFQYVAENRINWFKKLWELPAVRSAVKKRWRSLRGSVLSDKVVAAIIDEHLAVLPPESIKQNFSIWPVLGVKVWPNYEVKATYEEEVKALKTWIQLRAKWLDGEIDKF
jgi:hypothetical protein